MFKTIIISLPGYPSAYLLVSTEPCASNTACETMFSEASTLCDFVVLLIHH